MTIISRVASRRAIISTSVCVAALLGAYLVTPKTYVSHEIAEPEPGRIASLLPDRQSEEALTKEESNSTNSKIQTDSEIQTYGGFQQPELSAQTESLPDARTGREKPESDPQANPYLNIKPPAELQALLEAPEPGAYFKSFEDLKEYRRDKFESYLAQAAVSSGQTSLSHEEIERQLAGPSTTKQSLQDDDPYQELHENPSPTGESLNEEELSEHRADKMASYLEVVVPLEASASNP